MKNNILFGLLSVKTHFGMPRGAKRCFALNEMNRLLSIQCPTLPASMHHQWKEIIGIVCNTTNQISQGTDSRWKAPFEIMYAA